MYWLPNWEKETSQSIENAAHQSMEELREDIIIAEDFLRRQTTYEEMGDFYALLLNSR